MLRNFQENPKSVVVGNSVASLASIVQLKKSGKDLIWIQDGNQVDGVWRGFRFEGRTVDLGMINLEFDVRHPNNSHELMDYDQYSINDCARFINLVIEFFEELTPIKTLSKIKIFENDELYADHLISNDFSDLKRFGGMRVDPFSPLRQLHPSLKYLKQNQKLFLDISYQEYILRVYGSELGGKLFLNWAEKLIGNRICEMNALRHRAAWLPLPYPETIYGAITSKESPDLSYKFHYPKELTISEVVNGLFDRLNQDNGIEKVQLNKLGISEFKSMVETASNVLWAARIDRFLESVKYEEMYSINNFRNSVHIKLFEVEVKEEEGLYAVLNNDPMNSTWYRFTLIPNVRLLSNNRILAVEYTGQHFDFNHAQSFMGLGLRIIKIIKAFESIPAFLVLDSSNYEKYLLWHQKLTKKFPSVDLAGNSSFGYASSLSDQIIQGLKFARKVIINE